MDGTGDRKSGEMSREEAQEHDFDQRHDGPFHEGPHENRPSVQIDTNLPRRSSEPAHAFEKASKLPFGIGGGRKSMQATRPSGEGMSFSPPPRTSTQMSRGGAGRPSKDFDTRRDGPYGRPSLTMTRRQSSGNPLPVSTEGRRPTLPATESEKEQHQETELGTADNAEQPVEGPEPPASLETMQTDPAFEPEPPSLNYSLLPRKWSIIFFWSLIIIDCVAMPIGLYFGLWYGLTRSQLSANAVFSIVTAALGGVSIIEYVVRFRRLWKKGSTCRVIGARRMYLDWFHWNFSFGWVIVIVELIIGTIPKHPPIRLLAMPLVSMLYAFAVELLVVDTLRYFQIPAPVRVSSIPKGSQLRPGIYSIIEDVIAVDGSGGTTFREDLNKRYEASHTFRAMLRRLGIFWAFGSIACAVVCTILIFTIQHEAAYCVGWSVPFIWAGFWTLATYYYVRSMLKAERVAWAEEVAAKSSA